VIILHVDGMYSVLLSFHDTSNNYCIHYPFAVARVKTFIDVTWSESFDAVNPCVIFLFSEVTLFSSYVKQFTLKLSELFFFQKASCMSPPLQGRTRFCALILDFDEK